MPDIYEKAEYYYEKEPVEKTGKRNHKTWMALTLSIGLVCLLVVSAYFYNRYQSEQHREYSGVMVKIEQSSKAALFEGAFLKAQEGDREGERERDREVREFEKEGEGKKGEERGRLA